MAFEELKKGISDIVELDVVTFTGKISAAMKQDGGKNVLDWEGLLEKAGTAADLSLVAATKLKIDGDTILFIDSDASDAHLAVHREAVEAAQNYRRGVLELLRESLGID